MQVIRPCPCPPEIRLTVKDLAKGDLFEFDDAHASMSKGIDSPTVFIRLFDGFAALDGYRPGATSGDYWKANIDGNATWWKYRVRKLTGVLHIEEQS